VAKRPKPAKHEHLDFEVSAGEATFTTNDWETACEAAVRSSATRGGELAVIDVVTHSRAAARAWAGDYGTELYDEDPEASVFERFEVRARSVGRIP
jgi:hypothetical protein